MNPFKTGPGAKSVIGMLALTIAVSGCADMSATQRGTATGAITNSVAARAMPYMAMFGGTCCTPIALRVISSTMEPSPIPIQITTSGKYASGGSGR